MYKTGHFSDKTVNMQSFFYKKNTLKLQVYFFFLLLYRIWCIMTEDQNELLAVLDVRLHDLISLCEVQKGIIKDLAMQINTDKETLRQAEQTIQVLNAKYSELLTAHVVSLDDGDVKNARMRLLKLVREVEKCIALLNG